MATIKKVASCAGVSVATVSRFINGTAAVSEEAAARISEAIKRLDYHPNRLGRSLRSAKSNYILVLLPSIENSFLSHIIRGIQNVGNSEGYSILVGVTQNSLACESSYLELVKTRGVDGMIAISFLSEPEDMAELSRRYPIVQCSEHLTRAIPYVTIDNRKAACEITGRLIRRCGCRRPALISCSLGLISFREREQGYLAALEENGLKADPGMIVRVPLGFNAGKRAAERLLPLKPDAVLALADILALGAMRYFLDAGVRIPQDTAFAGFDGIAMGREFRPALTTVVQPAFEIGRTAARRVIDLIRGREIPNGTLLPYRIVMRGSTGAVP